MTELRAGDRIAGRYVLEVPLGEGGMGVVWRAADTLLDRTVALKRVRFTDVSDADAATARRRVTREARVAARLHHRNAITIFDVVEEAGEPWLVLEYLPSRSLAELLDDRGALPPTEVARIGEAVAAALTAAHAVGVVHRDVKPANVLVGSDGEVKLTDFGISRIAGDAALTATGLVSGTPAYLAPEIAAGGDAVPASDVFGLGATLYAAVEGHAPFQSGSDSNVFRVLAAAAAGRIPPPQRAGPLMGPLGALLTVTPEARPSAARAREMLAGVAEVRGPRPPAPPPPHVAPPTMRYPTPPPGPPPAPVPLRGPVGPSAPERPGRARRSWYRRPGPVTALAAVVVLALVAVVVAAVRLGGGSAPPPAAAPGSCDTSHGDLVVGLVLSLTGDLLSTGPAERDAADLAVNQANARCAVPGYHLVLRVEDDKSTAATALDAVTSLAADPKVVGVVLDTYALQVTQDEFTVLNHAGLAEVSAWDSTPDLTLGADYFVTAHRPVPGYFRLVAPNTTIARFAADHLVRLAGKKSFALVDDGTIYGRSLTEFFSRQAVALGARIVGRETISGDDPAPAVAKIKAGDRPDAVFFGGDIKPRGKLSSQLAAAGVAVPVVGAYLDDTYAGAGGRDGDLAVFPTIPYGALPSDFLDAYQKAGYTDAAVSTGGLTYDGVNLIVGGVATTVGTGTWDVSQRAAVIGAVQRGKTKGVSGDLAFDEFGDLVEPRLTVFELRNGQFDAVATRSYP